MKKIKVVIKGDTVYEINKFTGKPKRIIHGIKKYFQMRNDEEEERKSDNEQEIEYYEESNIKPESYVSPGERRKQILALVGNKKKLVSKADGLDREIPVDETEYELQPKKERFTKYRKKKIAKSKLHKPVKKCKCNGR